MLPLGYSDKNATKPIVPVKAEKGFERLLFREDGFHADLTGAFSMHPFSHYQTGWVSRYRTE